MESKWAQLPPKEVIDKTILALKKNNIEAVFAKDREDARKQVIALLRKGAEVFTMTSVTLDSLGISEEINKSDDYNSIRKKLESMDRKKQEREMQRLGAAPEFALGSIHAVTEEGEILIASNTGSQLSAYAYGASKVIFVVGTQKIVSARDDAFKRIYEHSLPLESERAKKAYGVSGSAVNKILLISKEGTPGRIVVIFVPEVLGY